MDIDMSEERIVFLKHEVLTDKTYYFMSLSTSSTLLCCIDIRQNLLPANYRKLIPEGVSEFPVLVCNLKYLHKAVKTLEGALLAIFTLVKVISDPVNLFPEIDYFIQRLGLQGHST